MTIDNLFDALTAAALDGDEHLDVEGDMLTIDGTFSADVLIRMLAV